MSRDKVAEKGKDALRAVRDLLEKAEETTHKALVRAAPAVQRSVDASMQAAGKGFTATMKSIDGATAKEQLELLKMYNNFLSGQLEYIQSRIMVLQEKTQPRK